MFLISPKGGIIISDLFDTFCCTKLHFYTHEFVLTSNGVLKSIFEQVNSRPFLCFRYLHKYLFFLMSLEIKMKSYTFLGRKTTNFVK